MIARFLARLDNVCHSHSFSHNQNFGPRCTNWFIPVEETSLIASRRHHQFSIPIHHSLMLSHQRLHDSRKHHALHDAKLDTLVTGVDPLLPIDCSREGADGTCTTAAAVPLEGVGCFG
ncbi:hypothetical protein BLNAU_21624 [Blattamonas nauphoetae]|uniref:Uncharacterized protein n=1 Tax=Blattamonas nauphoetae TaxID=2049346 RepID=A0ABQ9WVB9_9EUKA|nr:hypothetical protein BLNAU_21624 [Blattamonas nauphoetae]